MRQILIATDGLPCSREAIHHFIESAGVGEAEIHLLSVITPPADGADRDGRYMEAVDRAQEALDKATLDMALGGRSVTAFSRVGQPAEVIIHAAEELAIDLIVLGTRGPEGLESTHSVAEDVLHGVTCGVLIYPMRTASAAAV
jgi:nucleotide-binding universal stress UspA family protein